MTDSTPRLEQLIQGLRSALRGQQALLPIVHGDVARDAWSKDPSWRASLYARESVRGNINMYNHTRLAHRQKWMDECK